jgi:hypothetical protein
MYGKPMNILNNKESASAMNRHRQKNKNRHRYRHRQKFWNRHIATYESDLIPLNYPTLVIKKFESVS